MKVRFGDFLFDTTQRVLLRGEDSVPLSPKALQVLELLLRERPRALAKTELQDRIWPETFVVEANLPNLIAEIRRCLDDNTRPYRFVRTVHGFGYSFCGNADDLDAPAGERKRPGYVYRVRWDAGSAALLDGEHVLGRDPRADVHLDVASVSRCHARLSLSEGHMVIEDMGSRNGTFVRGERIQSRAPIALRDGERIAIGGVAMVVRITRVANVRETDSL
jgi:DNA-binding winged helix-turn-helix (wHTH) protein